MAIQLEITCHRFDANAAWLQIVLAATDWCPGRNSSGSPTNRFWPPARSTPSDTGLCTSPPAATAAPVRSGCGSTPPGDGPPPPSPKDGNNFEPPSHDRLAAVHPDPSNPTALETPADRATPADFSYPSGKISPHKPDGTGAAHHTNGPRPESRLKRCNSRSLGIV